MIDYHKYREFFNQHDLFSVNNGMKLVDLGEKYAQVELIIEKKHLNYMGSMHGGLLYTMADFAAGTSLIYCGKQVITISAHTEYIKPVFSGKVIAEAKVVSCGKTIARCEVDIYNESGTLCAKSIVSMFITAKDLIKL